MLYCEYGEDVRVGGIPGEVVRMGGVPGEDVRGEGSLVRL